MTDQNAVRIQVYGKEYTIRSPEDPEVTREYASYIDNLMREVGRKTGSLDVNRVAILALLQITHELFTLRKRVEKDEKEFNRRMDELLKEVTASMSKGGIQTEFPPQ
ncbi:MAG: cell division protein ZapA [Candidatus Nitrospinota bacterium M3_3B_026]